MSYVLSCERDFLRPFNFVAPAKDLATNKLIFPTDVKDNINVDSKMPFDSLSALAYSLHYRR